MSQTASRDLVLARLEKDTQPEDEWSPLVRHAWAVLSAACHHHPYDVAPSSHELREWIRVAARLNGAVCSNE